MVALVAGATDMADMTTLGVLPILGRPRPLWGLGVPAVGLTGTEASRAIGLGLRGLHERDHGLPKGSRFRRLAIDHNPPKTVFRMIAA